MNYKDNFKLIDWSKGKPYVDHMRIDHRKKEKGRVVVLNDIQPYRNMIDGGWITSRSQHKAFLKQHGVIEVGNERIKPKKPEPLPDVRIEMSRIYDQLSRK